MKTICLWLGAVLLFSAGQSATVLAETETIDLKALAKKARPAVMLVVVSDARGQEIGTGTGFLVSSDGKLFTNFHVIEKGASAVAKAENGGAFPVEGILAADPKNDLVLLKINGKDLPFLTLADDDKIEVGTRVAVIGSPLGLEGTLSEGIVSAVRELMGDRRILQITAAISPGSSGSPVLGGKGEVLGIATLIMRGGQALNFAVPCEVARSLQTKTKDSLTPNPMSAVVSRQEDEVYSDPDWQAAFAAEATENYAEMLKRCQALARRYPDSPRAQYGLGVAYGRIKFTDDAIAAFRQAIKLKPDYTEAWYNLGVVYGKAGCKDDQIAAFQQTVTLNPDFAKAWVVLGTALGKAGRRDDAIAANQQATKLQPDDAEAWYNLGVVFGEAGRKDDAIVAYERATKLKPNLAEAWNNLGLAYKSNGQMKKAWNALRQLEKLDSSLAQRLRVLLLLSMGDAGCAEDAIVSCQQATKLKPDDAEAWYYLGVAYGKARGKKHEEITAYKRAVELKPDYAQAWFMLGTTCYQMAGHIEEAIAAFQQTTKLRPGDAPAWFELGRAYKKGGQVDKGWDALRQLEKLDVFLAQRLRESLQSTNR